jgi:uncharacterized coiled-coil protein SlyX
MLAIETFAPELIDLSLTAKKAVLKELKELIKAQSTTFREIKAAAKVAKAQARADKQAARISALEAKLEALKNPVGAKASKASRKPGAVKVYNPEEIAEANAIAARIKATA